MIDEVPTVNHELERQRLKAIVESVVRDRNEKQKDLLHQIVRDVVSKRPAANASPQDAPNVTIRAATVTLVVERLEQQVNVQMPPAATRKVRFETDEDGNPVSAVITSVTPAVAGGSPHE
ncbi:unnamed protein product [Gemmataceae bacterium]|nr:unnamed protein product [Gemmataceae bacterium]VTT97977.1 unnamed protein product [Gemmataceae bacterium]